MLRKATRTIIDSHTHILPLHYGDMNEKFGYNGFITLKPSGDMVEMHLNNKLFRKVHMNCFATEQRLREMDESKITQQVICTVPAMFHYWAKPKDTILTSKFLNDDIAHTIRQHPDRYIGLGTLPMNSPKDAVTELERCITELNFQGVQIGSNVNEISLGDGRFDPLYKRAEELNAAILIHPWDMAGKARMEKYWLPWLVGMPMECSYAACSLIFSGVLDRYPNLRFCLSHGGGSFPFTIGRIEHGWKVRPDLVAVDMKDKQKSPREYLSRFYYDAHVCDTYTLQQLLHLVGPDRVMLGSDYPFPLGESPIGR